MLAPPGGDQLLVCNSGIQLGAQVPREPARRGRGGTMNESGPRRQNRNLPMPPSQMRERRCGVAASAERFTTVNGNSLDRDCRRMRRENLVYRSETRCAADCPSCFRRSRSRPSRRRRPHPWPRHWAPARFCAPSPIPPGKPRRPRRFRPHPAPPSRAARCSTSASRRHSPRHRRPGRPAAARRGPRGARARGLWSSLVG